jgi:hypothetical protein
MPTQRSVRTIWRQKESGVLVPDGTDSRLFRSNTQSYLQIKDKAKALEQLYEESAVPLPKTCDLAGLIDDAKSLSDSWLGSVGDGLSVTVLFRACLLARIADAVLPLSRVPDRAKYLTAITGSLNLLSRRRSKAKDVFWELELWWILLEHSFHATLAEPPDIVITFEDSKIGVACKKVYSERHIQNVLSEAVGQIEGAFDFGIVALNLDELVPANHLCQAQTGEGIGLLLDEINIRFLALHERHLRKYLASGRLLSAYVSTAAIADILASRARIHSARQSTVWTIPGLPPTKERQLKRFYDQLLS